MKKYRLGFDFWGLALFLVIMIPNFIWFAVPAPNDILRAESTTMMVDTIASICQVLMIVALCVIINKERKRLSINKLIMAVIICCLLYFISWIFYYVGVTNALVILGLTISPCLAFLFYAVDRKNMIAVVPVSIFMICHLIYGIFSFII
ncbi:MAG: hypothetical protein ACI4RC_01140 [Oscillospiraceae bacterium]